MGEKKTKLLKGPHFLTDARSFCYRQAATKSEGGGLGLEVVLQWGAEEGGSRGGQGYRRRLTGKLYEAISGTSLVPCLAELSPDGNEVLHMKAASCCQFCFFAELQLFLVVLFSFVSF